ncbi:MAG: phytoene desaturase family protein, partial [Rubripirellula sp.]
VSERMAEIAIEMGVKIQLCEPVTKVEMERKRVTKLKTDQSVYEADAFIINADFAHWMEKYIPDQKRRKWNNQNLAQKKYSCSTFMLYLGIDGQYQELPHHNIHISSDYERNLREIEEDHVLSVDPSFYVQNPCITDPSLAPPGKSGLYILVPVTHQHPNVDWKTEGKRFRDLTLNRLSQIGLTDLKERIVFEHQITPDDWKNDYAIYRGATFNLAHNLGQMLHRRPHNRFEELDGVYLVGGGTHPGSGLPVIYESSRITTKLLLKDLQ